jgi:hypothetical protein
VNRRKILLKLAVVGNAVLLVGLFVCYRAGGFNWLTGPSTPPVDPGGSDTPENNVSAGVTSETVAGDPKEAMKGHPVSWNWCTVDPKNPAAPPLFPDVPYEPMGFSMSGSKSGTIFHPSSPPAGATQQPPMTFSGTGNTFKVSPELFDPPPPPPKAP